MGAARSFSHWDHAYKFCDKKDRLIIDIKLDFGFDKLGSLIGIMIYRPELLALCM